MESYIFLLIILFSGVLSKNKSIIYPTLFVLLIKIIPYSNNFIKIFKNKGLSWGVMVITAAILMPIANGEIGLQNLISSFKNPLGWIAIFSGLFVSLLSAKGINLLHGNPELTVTLIIGTLFGVIFFKGIAVGPLIAAGIAYSLSQLINLIIKFL